MSLFDSVTMPEGNNAAAVRAYLEAQDHKDFARAGEFFDDDVVFHGLVLEAQGREEVAGAMTAFIQSSIEYIRLEAITEVEAGDTSRFLALYWFKLKPASEPQVLCDHITVGGGKIKRIENVFDTSRLPPM